MSRFRPESFQEALSYRQAAPPKSRKPMARKSAKPKKKKKREKLPSRKWLVKRLDTLTSLIVRTRDGGKCVLCGSSERLQCGHIFGRRSHGARFDIEPGGNTAAQCSNCNIKHNSHQWIFYSWYIDKYGREAFDAMYTRWSKGRKYSRLELIAMVKIYEGKWIYSQEKTNVA